MNWFRNRNENYPLSADESARGRAKAVNTLMFVVLGSVVVITAAHAILLVLYTTSTFANTGDGLLYTFLNVIRVSFPVVVEVAAVAIALGFITSAWREGQRSLGTFLEATWFLFAAANMITFFAVERGAELQGWQQTWVEVGLPLSALFVAALTYMVLKADPAHKRANEAALAKENMESIEANARNSVNTSDAMKTIHERRVWRETVNKLSAQGYDDEEISYMTAYIPELHDLEAARQARKATADIATAEQEPDTSWLKRQFKRRFSPQTAASEEGKITHRETAATPAAPGQGDTSRIAADDLAAMREAMREMLREELEAKGILSPTSPVPHPNGQEAKPSHP